VAGRTLLAVGWLWAQGAAAAPGAAPGVRVVLHGRERPGEVALSGAGALTCDGRAAAPSRAGEVRARREGDRVLLAEAGALGCRVLRVAAPAAPAAEGPCRGRRAFALRVGALQRCHEGTLEVRAEGGALRLVLGLPLERYVASVLVSEAADAPAEALAAQAVVTRSWALAHRGRHGDADACDLTHCQLYRGERSAPADAAARRTAGQVLHAGGRVVPAFFHAACGGHTAPARAVFGERGPVGVADVSAEGRPFCAEPPWAFEVARGALAAALRLPPRGTVRTVGWTADGRVQAVEAFGRVLSGARFVAEVTRGLGYGSLRSARFTVTAEGERLRFVGEGRGHGVGFCQVGAAARARAGQGYEVLLRAYFPGAAVSAAGRAISPPP
jgi:stage II sporulation protein D